MNQKLASSSTYLPRWSWCTTRKRFFFSDSSHLSFTARKVRGEHCKDRENELIIIHTGHKLEIMCWNNLTEEKTQYRSNDTVSFIFHSIIINGHGILGNTCLRTQLLLPFEFKQDESTEKLRTHLWLRSSRNRFEVFDAFLRSFSISKSISSQIEKAWTKHEHTVNDSTRLLRGNYTLKESLSAWSTEHNTLTDFKVPITMKWRSKIPG